MEYLKTNKSFWELKTLNVSNSYNQEKLLGFSDVLYLFFVKELSVILKIDFDIFHYFTPYSLLPIFVTVFIVYVTWFLFYRPFNVFRDFTELGYEQTLKNCKYKNNTAKRNVINELRKRRKVGNLPPSYPNGWFAILESDQLPVKTAKEVNALGQNLVAWRGESGKCYVSDAYCPHLGAHLGVGGTVKGDCIECPFHSWAFEGCSGKLKNIPYAESAPEFAKLKMWTVVEMFGFIFLWYHAENEKPYWMLDQSVEVESNVWKYRGRSELLVTCHIQEIPENGADVAHLNVLHAAPVLAGTNPLESKFEWQFLKHVWSATWAPNPDLNRQHEASLTVNHHFSLFNKIAFLKVKVDCRQVGPGIVLLNFETIFGNGVLIQTVTPLEPLLQRVTHRFYTASTFIHPIAVAILHSETIQISRDIRIWNRKTFLDRPILTKEDKLIKSFRRWYSQFYSKNSPRMSMSSNASPENRLDF